MPKKSWRTTALGVLAALPILAAQGKALLDSDPATVFSVEQVLSALALLGFGVVARDNKVSSEAAGAK